MDEPAYLRMLKDDPHNDQIRLAYCRWLEEVGDSRAGYARLMNERLRIQARLTEINAQLSAHWPRISDDWQDIVFPLCIRSPCVGRCYTAPFPNSPPLVAVGDLIAPDKVVCLIEQMCLYTEIMAGVHGVVAEVKVSNGDAVEYNQVLFRLTRPGDLLDW
jgi:uncharacterized protein (TIGR02996 family)